MLGLRICRDPDTQRFCQELGFHLGSWDAKKSWWKSNTSLLSLKWYYTSTVNLQSGESCPFSSGIPGAMDTTTWPGRLGAFGHRALLLEPQLVSWFRSLMDVEIMLIWGKHWETANTLWYYMILYVCFVSWIFVWFIVYCVFCHVW